MADSAEFTARAHLEAAREQAGGARARPEDRETGDNADRVNRSASGGPTMRDGFSAADAAREARDQVLAHPALATRAQANSNGATVLAMLL